jgi:CheY-like chemotaxis protein
VAAAGPESDAAGKGAQPLVGTSLLVVDDEADARDLFRVALELAGADVIVTATAAEALRALHTRLFDVILVDLGMPDQDGLQLIRAIRALPAPIGQLRAIAVTAYSSLRERELAFDAGFNAHVAKPIEVERLLRAVLDARPRGHERRLNQSMR